MVTSASQIPFSIYVDRNLPHFWIVRDRAGDFWMVPSGDQAWQRRQPYALSQDANLEWVPGHYLYMLDIAG